MLTKFRRWARANIGLLAIVVVPTVSAVWYYTFWVSDVYTSESRFIVRSTDRAPTMSLGSILQGTGLGGKELDEGSSVREYILSRDALRVLEQKLRIKAAYASKDVDIFSRFGVLDDSFEALHEYFQNKVDVKTDGTSSILTLTVKAFTPQTAEDANRLLLEQSEELVNRLNERGRQDLVRYAQNDVNEAEAKAKAAALKLSQYRTAHGVIDPERQASVQLQQIAKIQDELIATSTQLSQLETFTPANPQIPGLRNRARALQSEMANETARVMGDQSSLANKAPGFQYLMLEAEFASKQLASAMASLETARIDAQRKQVYIERISEPSLPDVAQEPRRVRSVISALILAFVAWGVLSMLVAGVREHFD